MSISVIDLLFLVTVVLLVMSGLRNGAVFSLFNLVGLPIGFGVAVFFGPQFTAFLAANGLPATPLISYVVLFLGTILVVHILANAVRGFVKRIPLLGPLDSLLGGFVGFIEAWLLWLILLIVLGNFLNGLQSTVSAVQHAASILPGFNISFNQLQGWHDFYNQAVTNSLFARINGVFVKALPSLPRLPQ
jgi:uncharacterized membrane protein required for colicin V production